jgi:uncharacterized membrane protein YozB (DUF420 family)
MGIQDLPALNASLNALATCWLLAGYAAIRSGRRHSHQVCMMGALLTSGLFLTSYVIYHANAGSRPFQGAGLVRYVYFAILATHVVLAAAVLPLALVTASRALSERFDAHKRLAKLTLPVWLYVSVTGVVIYLMLY